MIEQAIDLKKLERKVWTSFFEDGIWDIFIGLFFLTMGLRSVTHSVWFTLILLPAAFITWVSKKLITIPRIGYVRFQVQQKSKNKKGIGLISFAILISLLLLYLVLNVQLPEVRVMRAVFQGIALALTLVLIARVIYFKRLYIYGVVFTAGMVLWELLGVPIGPLFFIITGTAVLITGIFLLICFLRKPAVSTTEDMYDRDN